MLSRSTSPAHICLSCQLLLLRRGSALFHSTATRAESRSHRTKRAHSFQVRQFSSARLNRLKISYEYTSSPGDEHNDRDAPIRHVPVGRLYGKPSQAFREEAQSLDIDTLGVPSDVIILKDARKDWYPPPKLQAPPILPPEEDIDFLAAIEAERGLVGQSEVDANIEEHKPANPTVPLSEREFRRLRETIEEGFTTRQIRSYIKRYMVKEAEEKREKERTTEEHKPGKSRAARSDIPSLLYKTEWYPDITEENQPFQEHPLRGYSTIQHNTKQLLVLHVLRTCWKLDVREVVHSAGQVELRINGPEFELLISSSPSPLEPIISRLRNEDKERIDAFRSQGVLRITANRERALNIVEDIEKNILNRIQKVEINVTELIRLRGKKTGTFEGDLDQLAMNEAAKMTGTSIIRSSAKWVSICCVNNSPDSELASPAEVARRLLISYFTHFDENPRRLGLQKPLSHHIEALVRFDDLDCLPWYHRLRQWVRRTSAASKGYENHGDLHMETNTTSNDVKREDHVTVGDRTAAIAENPNQVSSTLSEAIARKPRSARKPHIKYWSTRYSTASSVVIGQVLHEKPNAMPIELVRDKGSFVTSNHQTFSTVVPNLLSFMERLKPDSESLYPQVSESVLMRFEPSPLSADGVKGSRNSKAFPPVELSFGIEEVDDLTRNLILKDVNAVVRTNTSDVMIPDRPVDLRFLQRTTSRISNLLRRQPAEITEFLKASQLNLVTGIRTPGRLILPMDPHLCTDPRAWKPPKIAGPPLTNVEYLFSGMDIKTKMQFDFNGWTLIYTDISSGKAGGKSREIRLRPTPTGSRVAVHDEDFIRTAFELVDAIGQSHSGERSATKMREIQWSFPQVRQVPFDPKQPEQPDSYFEERIFARNDSTDVELEEDSRDGWP